MIPDLWSRVRFALSLPVRLEKLLDSYKIDNSEDESRKVFSFYNSNDRFYHDIRHISSCLSEFDSCFNLTTNPHLLELVIWYHDVIYDPKSHDNEEKSAELLTDLLVKNGVSRAVISQAHDLILLTKHRDIDVPQSIEGKLLLDIDLSILGQQPDVFSEYEENIRREYSFIDDVTFLSRRKKFMSRFLQRPFIFHSDFFRNKYEVQARKNLSHLLE